MKKIVQNDGPSYLTCSKYPNEQITQYSKSLDNYLCHKCNKAPLVDKNDIIRLSNTMISKAANKLCELLKLKITQLNQIYQKVQKFEAFDDEDDLKSDDFKVLSKRALREI